MIAELDRRRAERWAPPPTPRSHLAFAKTMKLPDGRRQDENWDPDTEAMQACLCREADDHWWQEITAVASSQRGKSLLGVALPLLRTVIELAQDCVYVMPNLEKLEQNWHGKIRPMIEKCGFVEWLPTKGPASKGGKPAILAIRHPRTNKLQGRWYFSAAGKGGSETSLSSSTAQNVVVDEGDDFKDAGHLSLAARRTRSFGDRFRIWKVSTVNKRENRDSHPILEDYNDGTRSRLRYACMHCDHYQALEWEQVTDDGFRCVACGQIWSETDRKRSLRRWKLVHSGQDIAHGEVVGPRPTTRRLSLLCWDLEFAQASYAQVLGEYRLAEKAIEERADHEPMRQFYHKVLCRDYRKDLEQLETSAELTWEALLSRSQRCAWGPALHTTDRGPESELHTFTRHACAPPDAAQFACAGVDVQNNRLYLDLEAADADGGTYAAGWSIEYARPDRQPWNRQELHAVLDRANLVLRRWAGDLPIPFIGLDCREFTDDLRAWIDGRDDGWVQIMGTAKSHDIGDLDDVDGIAWRRDGIWHIHVNHTRELVHAALRRNNGSPGAAHLPHGLGKTGSDTAYLKHLVGERLSLDRKTGKTRLTQSGRWDWLDCKRIANALIRVHHQQRSRPPVEPIDLATWNRR